jgi:dienelactone hydrolase
MYFLIALFYSNSADAQVARMELHAIPSVTMSDADFLKGEKGGAPVTLGAILRLPKAAVEKMPAVVLLHTSGGMGGSGGPVDEWSRELNELGLATFAIDSFAGRGIVETSNDQTRLARLAMILDAYSALEHLAKHRNIDASRIAVMGFSRGGQSALYSAMTRFGKMHGPAGGLRFAAHISLYPDCSTTFRDADAVDAPIRILQGAADDYNPLASCQRLVETLQASGGNVQLLVYPDAHHVFDSPALKEPRKLQTAVTLRKCRLAEKAPGVIVNQETMQPFAYTDACVEKGPTIGYNEAASKKARADVKAFLSAIFKLKG